ncbi:MAG: ABC transporter substrate-binding protein [Rhodospirillales bacterium]|nr:ABC transporter substrate-binding protein [Rhodospirillales bacterium]
MTNKPTKGVSTPISRRTFAKGMAIGTAALASPFSIIGSANAAKPLKIGVLSPESGFFAREGQACRRGYELAGPMLADMGMPVEMMFADTESSADKARTAAEKLINEGAHILVGAFVSGHTMAIAQVAEQKGIPHIINIAAAPQITKQGYKYVFRNFATGPMLIKNGFGLIKDLFKATGTTPKTAVFMHVNDTFGKAMAGGVKALAPRMDLPFKIVETIAYDPKAKDLSVEIAKAKSTKADILLPASHGPDAIMMVREMVKQRWEPMGIMTPGAPGTYDQAFFKTLQRFSEYVMANVPWMDPNLDMTKTLASGFAKKYPKNMMELNVGFSFEATLIAADAYKRAGSSNPDQLAAALRETNITNHVMVGGPIQFNKEGQNVNIKSTTLQNLDRKPTVVLPAGSAEAKPVFPMPGWRDAKRK